MACGRGGITAKVTGYLTSACSHELNVAVSLSNLGG